MWQNIDLKARVDPMLIDDRTVFFKLSAWLGGWFGQDDHVLVALRFLDEMNGATGNSTLLQTVFAADRKNTTSLIYRETRAALPIGTRSLQVHVAIIRVGSGPSNDGYVDNIALILYQ